VTALGVVVSWATAADPPKPKSADDLARELSHPNFRTREAATRELWNLGESARPTLEKVAATGSPEAAERAQGILDKFDWGIAPDTPAGVLAHIKAFRDGGPVERDAAVLKLVDGGPANHRVLRQLLTKRPADPTDADAAAERRKQFEAFGKAVAARVPGLLLDGKADEAEGLLVLNALGTSEEHIRDYVLFMAARGRIKPAVEALTAMRKEQPDNRGPALALVYALRASGQGEQARAVLKVLADTDLTLDERYDALLADLGAWDQLADRPIRNPNSFDGVRAFRLRMAGKGAEADVLLKELSTADSSYSRGFGMEANALALFVNGRTADGLARLKATESAPHVAADIYAARLEFDTAFALIKAGLAEDNGTVQDGEEGRLCRTLFTLYKLKKARLLAQLGERDAAAQLLAGLEDVADRSDRGVQTELVRSAVRSGFPEIAAGLLGKIQARRDEYGDRPGSTLYDPFEPLFEADADAARYWWRVVRFANPRGNPGEQMRTVRDLLTGKLKPVAVAGWFEAADDYAKRSEQADHYTPASADPVRMAMGLAAAHRAYGQTEKAVAVLEAFADRGGHHRTDSARGWVYGLDETFRLWVDLGDWLGELGRHKDAAARLEQGWRLHPNNPVLLYLSGKALVAAGNPKEGRRRVELSHVVALGSPQLRARFLEELVNRGEKDDMRVELARLGECAWGVDNSNSGNVWNQMGRAAIAVRDFAAARDAQRKGMHFVLKTAGIVYVEGYAYANVPALARGLDARHLLAEGKVAEALAAADDALAIVPTHTDTLHALVTMLDKRGETAAADRLFAAAWERYAAAIRANPKSGWLKYQAAWLAVGCRREKETALKYAAEAVEDDPTHLPSREALAEAYFRSGDRGKATEIMTTLANDDRRNWQYKRQLERYKSAPFDAPLLPHEE
jgi:tetratricopeptide (TPR) repeat protein